MRTNPTTVTWDPWSTISSLALRLACGFARCWNPAIAESLARSKSLAASLLEVGWYVTLAVDGVPAVSTRSHSQALSSGRSAAVGSALGINASLDIGVPATVWAPEDAPRTRERRARVTTVRECLLG